MASIAMKMFRPAAMRSFANASRMGANVPSVSVGAIRFMSDLKFASTHEWAKDNGDGTVTVGISNHAQELLGDVVFVDLPEDGDEVQAGEPFSLVESVKAASDIFAPVSGEIVAINDSLDDSPETINEDPEEGGWIVKIKMSNASELGDLTDGDAYLSSLED